MRLYSIASGSSGNSIYVDSKAETGGVLIDAGISKKRIVEGLETQKISPENLQGIFITHEHLDHIKGLGPMVRKYNIPIYATEKTIQWFLDTGKCGKISSDLFQVIRPDTPVKVAGMEILPFSISHDAVEPVCYTLRDETSQCAVATDMGECDDYIFSHLKNCQGALLESNHDINMLQAGSYRYELKLRILGNKGHLSNDACGRMLRRLAHYELRQVLLGHLSEENNYPELAYETAKYELIEEFGTFEDSHMSLDVAARYMPTEPMVLGAC